MPPLVGIACDTVIKIKMIILTCVFPGVPEESLETAKEKAQKAKEVMQDPERAKEAAQEAARKASQNTMEAKEKVKAEAEETAPGHQHPLCSLSLKVLK